MEYTAELHLEEEMPLSIGLFYRGKIYGDKKGRFPDGTGIRTSTVERTYHIDGEEFAQTRNSVYKIVR